MVSFWRASRAHARRAADGSKGGGWPVLCLFVTVLGLGQVLLPVPPPTFSALPFLTGAVIALLKPGLSRERLTSVGDIVLFAIPLAVLLVAGTSTEASQDVPIQVSGYVFGFASGWIAGQADRWFPVLGQMGNRHDLLAFAIRWQFIAAGALLLRFVQLLTWQRTFHPFDILHAEFGALLAMAIAHFFRIAEASGQTGPRVGPGIILGFLAATSMASVGIPELWSVLPDEWLIATPSLIILALILLAILIGFDRAAGLSSILLSGHLACAVVIAERSSAPWPHEAGTLVALLLLFVLVNLAAKLRGDPDELPVASQTEAFQYKAGSWLARMDFEARVVTFPLSRTPAHAAATFGEFFDRSETAPLLQFLSRIDGRVKMRGPAVDDISETLTVTVPGDGPQDVTATLLAASSNDVWLSLRSLRESSELRGRLEELEVQAAKAMVREERLLSIASHEMRTPVTIMTMLVEEMKAGSDWREAEAGFETSLARLTAILNDLRASGTSSGDRDVFTVRELGAQLLEVFLSAAKAQGIRIRTEMPKQSDLAVTGDHARVMITLSKVLHNAIVHSKGTEIVVSAMVSASRGASGTVSWTIADDGVGIDEDRRQLLFEPFSSDGSEGLGSEARTGLGLYTARKAMRLIGGDIRLSRTSDKGCEFIITHPIRSADEGSSEEEEKDMGDQDNTPQQPELFAMLVEDNKLVGELTANRLRKIFGRVKWVEDASTARSAIASDVPDILFVDHLLPGMTGSELIRSIRLSHSSVPIVGVTASTMGSECEELEAAGADIAVEKPLSYSQIETLVGDLLAKPTAQ